MSDIGYGIYQETETEAKARYVCDQCGENIFEGEDYWNIGEERYCEECIDYAKVAG